jgi:serine/threonine-protein kinase HipA
VTARCRSCAAVAPDRGDFHARCLQQLFGSDEAPSIDVDLARLQTLALAMVGRVSISGVQRKLSVTLTTDRATLRLATAGGNFLLKVQSQTFPNLPENEWVTQRLAALCGVTVPPAALMPLRDGSLAYVVRRFDRPAGGKLPMEDFCQLSGRMPGEKYDGSAEQCAQLVRQFTREPLIELQKLYRQFAFAWCTGNGDLHLKNLALLGDGRGEHRLSPAFDLLNTRLVIPDDTLALPVCGKRDNLKVATWLQLAERAGLAERAARRVLREIGGIRPAMLELLADAPLPEAMRDDYIALLEQRSRVLMEA